MHGAALSQTILAMIKSCEHGRYGRGSILGKFYASCTQIADIQSDGDSTKMCDALFWMAAPKTFDCLTISSDSCKATVMRAWAILTSIQVKELVWSLQQTRPCTNRYTVQHIGLLLSLVRCKNSCTYRPTVQPDTHSDRPLPPRRLCGLAKAQFDAESGM